MKELAKSE